MAISSGLSSVTLSDILNKVSEFDILYHYFGVSDIPCIISSPLRVDRKPSFGIYSTDGVRIHWKDLAKNLSGGLWDMLEEYWGVSYKEVLDRIWEDLPNIATTGIKSNKMRGPCDTRNYSVDTILECKVRDWMKHDVEYWESFGISIDWLKYADIYPISHKIVIKGNNRYVFVADKYAYAYVERKEGKVTLKVYQPFNTKGYKWSNKHDRSVISLWTKVPEEGDRIIICSSMKDALCIWANTGIPCIAIQGEGYGMSDTAVSELRRRYKEIYILLDNDEAGVQDALKLSESTGFTNLVLPDYGAKDVSDLFKLLQDKDKFKEVILSLISGEEITLKNIPF